MNVKESVLKCLEERRGETVSGEELAGLAGVTRSAVWKAVKSLREEGHDIQASTNRGYSLKSGKDILTAAGIAAHVKNIDPSLITVYDSTDSTNIRVKLLAIEGAPEGTTVAADEQTAGRGRLGRRFVSPPGSGIYLTVLLRPTGGIEQTMLITSAAAVAVCEAIRATTGADAGIKWVNDIYIGEKKICGILAEAVSDCETGSIESVAVGIGINFTADPASFPPDVLERAGWIYTGRSPDVSRNELAAAVIDNLMENYRSIESRSFIERYRKYAIMLDRDVICISGRDSFNAHTVDIDDNGGLIVRMQDGTLRTLSTGEISVRW